MTAFDKLTKEQQAKAIKLLAAANTSACKDKAKRNVGTFMIELYELTTGSAFVYENADADEIAKIVTEYFANIVFAKEDEETNEETNA